MLQKYTITHVPSGRNVVVKAYTPEQAQRQGIQQLQKVLGLANPGATKPATGAAGAAHANNTTVQDSKGSTVATKQQTQSTGKSKK